MASCDADTGGRAVVTLSLGSRPFVKHTLPFMEAYARRVHAHFHAVDSRDHEALRSATKMANAAATRFMKLPLLTHFLGLYARVLYLDDDTLVGPATPDLFARVPCHSLGATVEQHKPQTWHAMHWRSACELYGVKPCEPRSWQLFNSGVMLLSRSAHASMLTRGWREDGSKLQCRILCDQLYLNALLRREGGRLEDLGPAFNFVGSELRRAMVSTAAASEAPPAERSALAARRRNALRDACVLHLTRKVPKLYTVDWVARRALGSAADVLQCGPNASWPPTAEKAAERRRSLLARLPSPMPPGKYEIGQVLCEGEKSGCALQPWVNPTG